MERTIKIQIPIRRPPPPTQAKQTVFAPAGMNPELATKIALLMEQEADERERRRVKRSRMVIVWACAGLVLLFGGLGVGLMRSPPPAVKQPRAVAPQIYDSGATPIPATLQPPAPALTGNAPTHNTPITAAPTAMPESALAQPSTALPAIPQPPLQAQ